MVESHYDLYHALRSLQVELNPLQGMLPGLVGEQTAGKSVHKRGSFIQDNTIVQSPIGKVPYFIPTLQRGVEGGG